MSRIPLTVPLGALAVLISLSPARGQQFSDWSPPMNLGPIVNSNQGLPLTSAVGRNLGGPGKFKVGHSMIQIVHTSSTGQRRPVDVMPWYPAKAKQWKRATPSVYRPRMWGVTLVPGTLDPMRSQVEGTLARDNVPMCHGRAFPLVIHSHANVTEPFVAAEMCEIIASHGYVVAAPYHTRNTADDGRINLVNTTAGTPVLDCLDGLPRPCLETSEGRSVTDRVLDVRAIMDNIGSFLGDRVDTSRVAIIGHSRGGMTALAAAGGSAALGIAPLGDRLKGIVVWSGVPSSVSLVSLDYANITIPTVFIAASADQVTTTEAVRQAYDAVTADKMFVEMNNAVHRAFTSGLCRFVQSAGGIFLGNSRAFLDRRVTTNFIVPSVNGQVTDFCNYSDFTVPTDITSLVQSTGGFTVTPTSVPATLSADDAVRVNNEVSLSLFKVVLKGHGHVSNRGYLNPEFLLSREADAVLTAEATYLPRDGHDGAHCDRDDDGEDDGDDDDREPDDRR